MTVSELNKKVDILEKMENTDGEMIKKLTEISELQQEQIKNLNKRIDLIAKKVGLGDSEKDNKVITISKQEFLEEAAKIGAEFLMKDSPLNAAHFTMAAATMASVLFDMKKDECDHPDKCHECDKILTCRYWKKKEQNE